MSPLVLKRIDLNPVKGREQAGKRPVLVGTMI